MHFALLQLTFSLIWHANINTYAVVSPNLFSPLSTPSVFSLYIFAQKPKTLSFCRIDRAGCLPAFFCFFFFLFVFFFALKEWKYANAKKWKGFSKVVKAKIHWTIGNKRVKKSLFFFYCASRSPINQWQCGRAKALWTKSETRMELEMQLAKRERVKQIIKKILLFLMTILFNPFSIYCIIKQLNDVEKQEQNHPFIFITKQLRFMHFRWYFAMCWCAVSGVYDQRNGKRRHDEVLFEHAAV